MGGNIRHEISKKHRKIIPRSNYLWKTLIIFANGNNSVNCITNKSYHYGNNW